MILGKRMPCFPVVECIVGYLLGIPVLPLCEPHLMIRLFLSSLPYITASRKACQRCCEQSLIITPEITHYATMCFEFEFDTGFFES